MGIRRFSLFCRRKRHPYSPHGLQRFSADFPVMIRWPSTCRFRSAQTEAHVLMMSTNNMPSNGRRLCPSQDIILGTHYVSIIRDDVEGVGMVFKDVNEALFAYSLGRLLHAKIKVRLTKYENLQRHERCPSRFAGDKIIETTVGRCMLNDMLPAGMPFYNFSSTRKGARKSRRLSSNWGANHELLDNLKELGFKQATRRCGIAVWTWSFAQ